jgi:hypothetical protein
MRYLLILAGLCVVSATCTADEPEAATSAASAAAAPTPAAPITDVSATKADQPSADGKPPARFTTEAKWDTAGYNNDEIVYTILVKSQDSRIIRCTTSLQGSYYENGAKQSVSDRQLSTVFPDQQVQVGNWMGMDQQSGATYAVHCHPL